MLEQDFDPFEEMSFFQFDNLLDRDSMLEVETCAVEQSPTHSLSAEQPKKKKMNTARKKSDIVTAELSKQLEMQTDPVLKSVLHHVLNTGMTVSNLATSIGVPKNSFTQWVKGKIEEPQKWKHREKVKLWLLQNFPNTDFSSFGMPTPLEQPKQSRAKSKKKSNDAANKSGTDTNSIYGQTPQIFQPQIVGMNDQGYFGNQMERIDGPFDESLGDLMEDSGTQDTPQSKTRKTKSTNNKHDSATGGVKAGKSKRRKRTVTADTPFHQAHSGYPPGYPMPGNAVPYLGPGGQYYMNSAVGGPRLYNYNEMIAQSRNGLYNGQHAHQPFYGYPEMSQQSQMHPQQDGAAPGGAQGNHMYQHPMNPGPRPSQQQHPMSGQPYPNFYNGQHMGPMYPNQGGQAFTRGNGSSFPQFPVVQTPQGYQVHQLGMGQYPPHLVPQGQQLQGVPSPNTKQAPTKQEMSLKIPKESVSAQEMSGDGVAVQNQEEVQDLKEQTQVPPHQDPSQQQQQQEGEDVIPTLAQPTSAEPSELQRDASSGSNVQQQQQQQQLRLHQQQQFQQQQQQQEIQQHQQHSPGGQNTNQPQLFPAQHQGMHQQVYRAQQIQQMNQMNQMNQMYPGQFQGGKFVPHDFAQRSGYTFIHPGMMGNLPPPYGFPYPYPSLGSVAPQTQSSSPNLQNVEILRLELLKSCPQNVHDHIGLLVGSHIQRQSSLKSVRDSGKITTANYESTSRDYSNEFIKALRSLCGSEKVKQALRKVKNVSQANAIKQSSSPFCATDGQRDDDKPKTEKKQSLNNLAIAQDGEFEKGFQSATGSGMSADYAGFIRAWNHACECDVQGCPFAYCQQVKPSVSHQQALQAQKKALPCKPSCKHCQVYAKLILFSKKNSVKVRDMDSFNAGKSSIDGSLPVSSKQEETLDNAIVGESADSGQVVSTQEDKKSQPKAPMKVEDRTSEEEQTDSKTEVASTSQQEREQSAEPSTEQENSEDSRRSLPPIEDETAMTKVKIECEAKNSQKSEDDPQGGVDCDDSGSNTSSSKSAQAEDEEKEKANSLGVKRLSSNKIKVKADEKRFQPVKKVNHENSKEIETKTLAADIHDENKNANMKEPAGPGPVNLAEIINSLPPNQLPVPAPTASSLGEVTGGDERSHSLVCVICHEEDRHLLFKPCNHICACKTCFDKGLEKCPICRIVIEDSSPIFLS